MALEDVLKVVAIGIILTLLSSFFEAAGKKEYTFILYVIAYMYLAVILLRFIKQFFIEIDAFFKWMAML